MPVKAQAIAQRFQKQFGSPPVYIARAPGRVNLLGEHVDYNEGIVLPAAINRETLVAFAASDTEHSTILASDLGEQVTFSPQTISTKTQADGSPLPRWARYPAGVAWALEAEGLDLKGMLAVLGSSIPPGAGLSSSASIELAFVVAWMALSDWSLPPLRMALLAQKAENHYVGVNCGIMDQFSSACGEAGKLLALDCRSLEWKSLPFPDGIAIVVADTKVRHQLADSEYNLRRKACEVALRLLQQDLPSIRALRDVGLDDFSQLATKLPDELRKPTQHVVEEIDRVQRAIPLLKAGDYPRFGQLMNASHASLRDLYEVSCTELDVMVKIAQPLTGCFGARLTGAGFGGCTVNLVSQEAVESFVAALTVGYQRETGIHPDIYICHPSEGARVQDFQKISMQEKQYNLRHIYPVGDSSSGRTTDSGSVSSGSNPESPS